jgi:hypothetical protein
VCVKTGYDVLGECSLCLHCESWYLTFKDVLSGLVCHMFLHSEGLCCVCASKHCYFEAK